MPVWGRLERKSYKRRYYYYSAGRKISAYLFGGGLDSNVSGNVHIVLDGENVVVSQLFGGGHAKRDL